jgi:ribosomal protein S3AE
MKIVSHPPPVVHRQAEAKLYRADKKWKISDTKLCYRMEQPERARNMTHSSGESMQVHYTRASLQRRRRAYTAAARRVNKDSLIALVKSVRGTRPQGEGWALPTRRCAGDNGNGLSRIPTRATAAASQLPASGDSRAAGYRLKGQ